MAHGACRGADLLAAQVALKFGWTVKPYPYIRKLGKAGGPVRNNQMLVEVQPMLVTAFHDDLSKSKGTRGCVDLARAHGFTVEQYNRKGELV